MKLQVREQIKTLLAQENVKLKELAQLMTEKTGKKYTYGSLHNKLSRGTISYNEVLLIADLLGFKLTFDYKDEK